MNDKSISFYIPVYNGKDTLDLALVSVMEQRLRPTEVIVIDDASTDTTREIVLKHNVTPILLNENQGLGHARNLGWRKSTGEFVASCDADVVLEPDWTGQIIKEFDDPQVAGAGGMLVDVGNDITCLWRKTHMAQNWGPERNEAPRFLFGANTVFRRKVLEEIGGYNELFRTNNEDVDICKKILAHGYKLVYTPAARADHIKQTTISSLLDSLWRWYESKYSEERHFVSLGNLLRRIEKVNFGIFEYKTGLDLQGAGPESNLAIDLLIPLRMTLNDLKALHSCLAGPIEQEQVADTIRECLQSMLELLVALGFRFDCACWALYKLEDAVRGIYALDVEDLNDKRFSGKGHRDYVEALRSTMAHSMSFEPAVRERIEEALMTVRGQGY